MADINSTLQSNALFSSLQPIVINSLIALLILLIGFIVGKIVGNLLKRLFKSLEIDNWIMTKLRVDLQLENFLSGLIAFAIYLFSVIMALRQIGLLNVIGQALVIIVVVIALVMLFLGMKNVIPNVVAGFVVKSRLPLRLGKTVTIGTIQGTISGMTALYICIKTPEEDILYVPFSTFLQQNTRIKKS
jgi:potassium-dependent mechanosensitive channel